MTSKRLIGIGDSIIMNSKNINSSANSISLDKSMRSAKSIRTISTNETPRRGTSKENISSQPFLNNIFNEGRLSTDSNYLSLDNISKRNFNKYFMNYINTEQNKEASEIISDADKIIKQRKKNLIIYNQLVKSTYMKNTNEISLDNYKIRLMKDKRKELNTKLYVVNRAMKSNEKIFEEDYKKFLEFVENTNNSYKRQEFLLNKYKKLIDENEIEYNKQYNQNKKLKEDIEFIVRKILTLRYYGSFIHNVFKIDFVYENIKRTEGKNLLNVAEDIIKTYEKNNEKGYEDKLLGEYWLMAQINEFEQNILSIINEKESFKKELIKIECDDKEEIIQLNNRIKELEKRLEIVKEDKNKFMKSIQNYDNPEIMDTVLDCIAELTEIFGLNTAYSSALLKEKTATNYTSLCSDLIKHIKEKENEVINHIEEIENIINMGSKEEKSLIEEIITERRKEIKKRKLFELIKEQKDQIMKKNMKAIERANRIVIKGRKVIDFRIHKANKKKKKIKIENNEDDILYYSSEEK